jgi:hypothetical protein
MLLNEQRNTYLCQLTGFDRGGLQLTAHLGRSGLDEEQKAAAITRRLAGPKWQAYRH